jgi:hypothetical protein
MQISEPGQRRQRLPIHRFYNHTGTQGRRNRGARGARAPPNFFKGLKVPFFVMKSALFVQANVAVNTKLTSKVPFLFGNFQVFKKNLVKNVQFRYQRRENFSRKKFLDALFNSEIFIACFF